MKRQASTYEEMMKGFTPVEEAAKEIHVGPLRRIKLEVFKLLIAFYRSVILPLKRKSNRQFDADMERLSNIELKIPRYGLEAGPDNHYLKEEEIQDFEKNGFIAPFRLMSVEEAELLRKEAFESFEEDNGDPNFIGEKTKSIFKKHNSWTINLWGWYRALSKKSLRKVLSSPQITQRLASILGPDVVCWRSQFFEKKPGAQGTVWHQASNFQENSKSRKLVPSLPTPAPIIQLTVWIALTEVREETGAMRILPGTFKDGRLEHFYEHGTKHKLDFIARLDKSKVETALKVAFWSPGVFTRTKVAFEAAMAQIGDPFEGKEVRNLVMKPGEAIIFSSLNMHSSFPNTTKDKTRLAFAARYTSNSVRVYPDTEIDYYPSPEGQTPFSTLPLKCIQVHGEDKYGHNSIFQEPS